MLVLVVFGLVSYGFYVRLGPPRLEEREPEPLQNAWSIPQSWQAIPELLCRGHIQQAQQLIADEDTAIERPPEQLYLLGLLAGYFNDLNSCQALLARASKAQVASIPGVESRLIGARLDALKLTKEDLSGTSFDVEDAQFINRAFIYRCIAESVLGKIPAGVEQAEALVAWTRRMVAPFEPEPHDVLPVIAMARGFGACERLCWVMLAIARQKGILGFTIYLTDAEQREPVHTICQIFPGGMAVLCDPMHGIVFRGTHGEPLDLYRVQRDPVILQQYAAYAGDLGPSIQHAVFQWWPSEAQAVFPRMKFLQAYADRLPLAPCLFQDADEEMGFLSRYLYELPGGGSFYREVHPEVSGFAFGVRNSFRNPEHINYVSRYMQHYQAIAQARLLHLQGQFELAERGYAAALGTEQPRETRELAAIFHAECLYELGSVAQSRRELTAFLETYPESVWTDQVHYYLGLLDLSPDAASGGLPSATGTVKSEKEHPAEKQ